jgi:membrane protein involved in colicin uptake
MRQQKADKEESEPLTESASRLGRFGETTKKKGDTVKNIQEFAKREAERARKKKEEEEAKKKAGVTTAPEKGFLQRMYEKYVGGSSEKK